MLKRFPALMLLVGAASGSTPIAPGRWQLSNQMDEVLFNGKRDTMPLPPSRPRRACLAKADAAKGPGLAFSNPDLCRVLNSSVQDGSFSFETECKATESADTILTKTVGSYTPDSYSGRSTSIQRRDGMEIEMRSQIEGKRLGDC